MTFYTVCIFYWCGRAQVAVTDGRLLGAWSWVLPLGCVCIRSTIALAENR